MEAPVSQTYATAVRLATKGIHIFPCLARDKRPATPHGYKDATTDLAIITQWFRQDPDLNLAIATGTISNLFVVDVDNADAEMELRKLEAQLGNLPSTVEVITARGRHLYFKTPGMPLRNSASKIAPGIDTRADGGYVLAPPSIHPSGKQYAWSVDSAKAIAAAPAWLVDKLLEVSSSTATPVEEWRHLFAGGVGEGQRDCTLAKISGHLLRRYVDPHVVLDLMHAWNGARCRPPLPDADVVRIVDSICAMEARRRGGRG
jgi:hypothetical protein